jgi:dCTP deaminase
VPLSDRDILEELAHGRIGIDPQPRRSAIQPASLDVTLGEMLRVPSAPGMSIDFARPIPTGITMPVGANGYVLRPGAFVLASTAECVTLPDDVAAQLDGRSTLGRLGLLVHSTAGWIDPGFSGHITLELSNVGPWELVLRPGMAAGQLVFERMSSAVIHPYGTPGLGSRYQGQHGPTAARPAA